MKTMNYYLVRILFSIAIGLVLVFFPDVATKYITIVIGALFLIPGLISLIAFFLIKPGKGKLSRFPIEGVGSLLLGLWLVAMPEFFNNVLMFLLGFLLVLGGIQQLASLFIARRSTSVSGGFYVVPVLILATGLITLFNPAVARQTVLVIIGIACLVYSIAELINWFRFAPKHSNKVGDKASRGYIEDAEIIDPD